MHGAASGSQATSTLDGDNVNGLALGNGGTAYTNYVKFGGTELERFIVITATDCTNVKRFGVKAARGNNINGGELPDDSADELRVYYNTDNSLNFPESNFLGVLVPRPSDDEIANDYDGNGTGPVPTKWYSYFVDLPAGAPCPHRSRGALPGGAADCPTAPPCARGLGGSGSNSTPAPSAGSPPALPGSSRRA